MLESFVRNYGKKRRRWAELSPTMLLWFLFAANYVSLKWELVVTKSHLHHLNPIINLIKPINLSWKLIKWSPKADDLTTVYSWLGFMLNFGGGEFPTTSWTVFIPGDVVQVLCALPDRWQAQWQRPARFICPCCRFQLSLGGCSRRQRSNLCKHRCSLDLRMVIAMIALGEDMLGLSVVLKKPASTFPSFPCPFFGTKKSTLQYIAMRPRLL